MSEAMTVTDDADCGCEAVCALPAEQIAERTDHLRARFLPYVRGHDASATRVEWRFDDTEEMRARLDELVEFERQCCAALDFRVEASAGTNELTFTVRGDGADLFTLEREKRTATTATVRAEEPTLPAAASRSMS